MVPSTSSKKTGQDSFDHARPKLVGIKYAKNLVSSSEINLKLVVVQILEQIKGVEAPEARTFESINSIRHESNR